eukprot:295142_1
MPFRKDTRPVWFNYQPENLNASEPPNPGRLAEILARILERTEITTKLKMAERTSLEQLKHDSLCWVLWIRGIFETHKSTSSSILARITAAQQRQDRHRENTLIVMSRITKLEAQCDKRTMEGQSLSQEELREHESNSAALRRIAKEQSELEALMD